MKLGILALKTINLDFDKFSFKDCANRAKYFLQFTGIFATLFLISTQLTAAPLVIGYYDMSAGSGVTAQRDSIISAGHTAVNITVPDVAQLTGIDLFLVQNPSNGGYGAEYLANLVDIENAVLNGMTLMIHDRHVTNFSTILPNGGIFTGFRNTSISDTTFLVAGTFLTNGPGGVLDDSSLDNGNSSHHGYILGNTLPVDAIALMSRTDTNEIVSFVYAHGSGRVYYSTIPLDFYLASPTHRPNFNVYAINAIAYASLFSTFDITGVFSLSESGSQNSTVISFALRSAPVANVVLNLGTVNGMVMLDRATLTFTPINWSVPQQVTFQAINNSVLNPDRFETIDISVTTTDPVFVGTDSLFKIEVYDDEAPNLVEYSIGSLDVYEGGSTTSLSFKLNEQPAGTVTFPVTVSDLTEITAAPANMVFDSANWNVVQTIIVTGVADGIDDDDQIVQLSVGTPTTTDPADFSFANISTRNYSITNYDIDGIVDEYIARKFNLDVNGFVTNSRIDDIIDDEESNTVIIVSSSKGSMSPLLLLPLATLFICRRRRGNTVKR